MHSGYMNSKHGAIVIIPREEGYVRMYVQTDLSKNGAVAASRPKTPASKRQAAK